jgi:hypothetical protein
MGNYFTVTVKPYIAPTDQALGAFADNDVLFNWTEFDIPKGANKLIGAVALIRGTDGAAQSTAFNFYIAKTINGSQPGNIGTVHATAGGNDYQNSLIGGFQIEEADVLAGLDIMNVGMGRFNRGNFYPQVLEGEPDSGTNVGYDKLYLASTVLDGTPNFASTVQVDGNQLPTNPPLTTLTVKTTSARTNFDVGDVLQDESKTALGTVAKINSATEILLDENGLLNVATNNQDVYNTQPVTIILSFER